MMVNITSKRGSFLSSIGRFFFAIAFVGLGGLHFIFHDFITGRAPAWPEAIPGRLIWAYGTGIGIIVMSAMIAFRIKARSVALTGALLIAVWALMRHIPVVASDSFLSGSWTAAGKGLTFTGGLLAIAAISPRIETLRNVFLIKFMNLEKEFIVVARCGLGIFMIICGIQHFIFTAFVASLIPVWFPGDPVFWT